MEPRLQLCDISFFQCACTDVFDLKPRLHDGTEPFRSRANSLPGANWSIGLWPIRSLANSFPGHFAPWNFCSVALSLLTVKITIYCEKIHTTKSKQPKTCSRKSDIKMIHSASSRKKLVTQLKPWFHVKIKLF